MIHKNKRHKTIRVIHPNAAGIDIGAKEFFVAIPEDRSEQTVRKFDCFTDDLHKAAEWMKEHEIDSVAMESTGIYWIPIYQILDTYGFEIYLVNARHVKNVPGRKTDVKDSQWLQYLHSVGLLDSSYRPEQEVCVIRSLLRHRGNVLKMASSHVQHMQKALTQMNIQLHNVISDITGETGLKIIDSLLSGNHDPQKLVKLKSKRIKASKAKIIKSLTGDYRAEHLFTLRQSLESYRFCQKQINACDLEIERFVIEFESKFDQSDDNESKPEIGPQQRRTSNMPNFDVQNEMFRIFGTDLTRIDGISSSIALTLFCEIGPVVDKFPTAKHFCSWLGLSPNNKISGGKILYSKTKKTSNKATYAFRLAANSLYSSKSYLGDYFRRMRGRHGAPKAITVTAHKIARIFYYLVKNNQSFDSSVFVEEEKRYKKRKMLQLKKQAKDFGFQLVEANAA